MIDKIKEILANGSLSISQKLQVIDSTVNCPVPKRCFVVWFKRYTGSETYIENSRTMVVYAHPTEQQMKDSIAKLWGCDEDTIFITNWKELSEADYNDFIK